MARPARSITSRAALGALSQRGQPPTPLNERYATASVNDKLSPRRWRLGRASGGSWPNSSHGMPHDSFPRPVSMATKSRSDAPHRRYSPRKMSAVREFARATLGPLGAPAGDVETYIEMPFDPADGRRIFPYGLIRIKRGSKSGLRSSRGCGHKTRSRSGSTRASKRSFSVGWDLSALNRSVTFAHSLTFSAA
jgi:hypothetical protein